MASSFGAASTTSMNNAGGSVATTSSSSLTSYSPISTLERQYNMGQRLMVFVSANAACCLEGGVESIIKLKGDQTGSLLSSDTVATPASFEETTDDDFDAFAFLNENGGAGGGGSAEGNGSANNGNYTNQDKKNRIGGFFRKVAQSTTATLERQMQGLAVRMDKGRNPDLLRVAMYDATTQELLGVSDSQALPSPMPQDEVQKREETRFQVPLIVPGNRRRQPFILKLWIQSGAALLQSTKAAKNYLLGMAVVDGSTVPLDATSTYALTSNLVVGGALQVYAMSDPKFAQIHNRGWSLTDPDMSAYSSNLCHLPLDQSYLFSSQTQQQSHQQQRIQPHQWLIGTERATESSVVLPIAAACMELAGKACMKSNHHAQTVGKVLRSNRHDFKDPTKATCNLGVVGVVSSSMTAITNSYVQICWRRPDSIFELELTNNIQLPVAQQGLAASSPAFKLTFYPRVCTSKILPGILNTYGGTLPPSGYLLGGLYFAVTVRNSEQVEIWETVIGMESFVDNAGNTVQIPLHKNGQQVGQLLLQLQVQMNTQTASNRIIPPTDGLVSCMGLEAWADGVEPAMDCDLSVAPSPSASLRHQQLATMGFFCTINYMDQHLAIRKSGFEAFQERARAYRQALIQPEASDPFSLKSPKAFRPSSSRPEALLSGIPFNVHVASINLNIVDTRSHVASSQEPPGAVFHNITCGAPSDHARGFGNVLDKISNVNVSGGLRRLESRRYECAQALQQAQSLLIAGVGNYLSIARKSGNVNHVPSRHAEIQGLRWKVFECVQNLIHVTWMCAVRRANVFSQSLGLAVSSYLTSLSDTGKCAAGWPEHWKRHGYLVGFEGLLSAAGKELGMIEDASVAIAMLRNVRVVLMQDTGVPSKAVQIPGSPYLKWVNLFTSGEGTKRHYLLQIGVDVDYYNQRIPAPLQNGTAVQLYPLLFQVGVDIRQWGAHQSSNIMKQQNKNNEPEAQPTGGLVDDEDDDVGVPDNDVLVALNFEALRKLNAYAHAVSPQSVLLDKVQAAMVQVFTPQYGQTSQQQQQEQQLLPVHPTLSVLHSHVMSSAGKMNHSILDEAATLVQQFGGGGLVYCKSGKDRTAMHLTFKQAQFAARYRQQQDPNTTLQDAMAMRLYGTRLPICEKNVGQAKYAFNSLQVKFMPDALKPPMNTLAGFLKGGRIFGEGAIES